MGLFSGFRLRRAPPTRPSLVGAARSQMWFPTPTVMDAAGFCGKPDKGRTGPNSGRTLTGKCLEMAGVGPHAKFATPQARDFRSGQAKRWDNPGRSRNLNDQCAKYPTPTVNDSKNCSLPPSQIKHDNLPGHLLRDGEAAGGQLNPVWVEWLMGWPLGSSGLKPLGTGRYRKWLRAHGVN